MNRKQRRAATKLGRKPGDPRNPVYLCNHGVVLAVQGKLEEAIASFRQAINIKPDHAEAHYNLGISLAGQGKLEASLRRQLPLFGRRSALNRHAEAHSNLGVALAGQGKLKEAITAYRQAIGIKSDYAEVHSNLGSALKDQGRRQLPPIGRRSASNPTLPRLTPIWPIA